MGHLVVVVPGIGGSVLERDGRDLWRLSLPVAWRALRSVGRSLDELVPDDPTSLDDPEFDDGVRPAGLLESPVSLPGLARMTGYDGLRAAFHDRYELNEFNYVEFAYDWRRDVQHAAERLRRVVDAGLARLDPYVGRAEVIVVAHSMGGLVARWWLDQLGGAERCRGLITLGTPYRGSPKAIRMLSGGYVWRSVGSRRLADLLRALPSVHQLLPMYRSVEVDGEWRYVHEVAPGVMPGIDPGRAAAGRELLLSVNASARPTLTTVIAGVGQATSQSAAVRDGRLVFDTVDLPDDFGPSGPDDGDATVPWIASRPLDQGSGGVTPTFVNQSHGGLSRDRELLQTLLARIDHLLLDRDPARSPFVESFASASGDAAGRRLGFDLDEEYLAGEPVTVRIVSTGLTPGTPLTVEVSGSAPVEVRLDGGAGDATGSSPDEHVVTEVGLGTLLPGTHALRVRPTGVGVPVGLEVLDSLDVWDT